MELLKRQDNFEHMVKKWGIDEKYQDDFIMYLIYTNNVVLEDLGQGGVTASVRDLAKVNTGCHLFTISQCFIENL